MAEQQLLVVCLSSACRDARGLCELRTVGRRSGDKQGAVCLHRVGQKKPLFKDTKHEKVMNYEINNGFSPLRDHQRFQRLLLRRR